MEGDVLYLVANEGWRGTWSVTCSLVNCGQRRGCVIGEAAAALSACDALNTSSRGRSSIRQFLYGDHLVVPKE